MAADPTDFDRRVADAVACHSRGELDTAAARYQALLTEEPTNAFIVKHLALVRLQQKRLDEAWTLFERAIGIDQGDAELVAWKGEIQRQRGDIRSAIALLDAAVRARPDFAPALFNLGLAYMEADQPDLAHATWTRFLALRPNDARIRRELGHAALDGGHLDQALAWYVDQLTRFPQDRLAVHGLASTLMQKRETAEAIALLQRHVGAFAQDARALALLAKALSDAGRFADARDTATRAAAIDRDDVQACVQAARAYDRLGLLEDSLAWLTRAAVLSPSDADIRNSMAVAYLNLAQPALAVEYFRAAVKLRPAFKEAHSNLLMALHYIPDVDPNTVLAEHVAWADRHADVPRVTAHSLTNSRIAKRRLRVGYCSPRFGSGPLERFFTPVLQAHDQSAFEITCFAFSDMYDDATRVMMAGADAWQWCASLDDMALADLVRRSQIDVLVDLVGHAPGNRLGAFARRAAPVQLSWMDYVDTTAVPAMDYFVTDARHTPASTTQRFTETLVAVEGSRYCYRPADDIPDVRVKRAAGTPVVFGCFNRLSKITDRTVALWARSLHAVADSRLLLKATAFASKQTRYDVAQRFAAHGIDARRLDLRRPTSVREMLEEYNEVDIVLDPLPYNGCTTTCDALTMGVPVITREGTTFAGRHSTALLSAAGFTGWVATSDDQFVRLTAELAMSASKNEIDRASIRAQFLDSSVCDAAAFARKLEAVYRDCWSVFCEMPAR